MLSPVIPRNWFETWLKTSAFALLAVLAMLSLAPSRLSAQDLPVIIGRIEGDDLVVKTTTHGGVEVDAGPTVVASGSDVTLRSGHALLLFDAGGEISICGPAHFTLLKSAGAVTLALDYGRVHPSLDSPETLTIYTPMVVATPIAISGARRDTTLGLGQNGEMCILAAHGAMRVEPQFSGPGLIVPQGGVASLVGGQIESSRSDASSCSCDFPRASVEHPRPSSSQEISALSHPLQPEHKKTDAGTPAAPVQEPVYTVLMPPLSFDASSPTPLPDPSPETILLVREVRVSPSIVYHGHVNPAPVQATPAAPPTPAAPSAAADDRPAQTQPGILTRLGNFFRRLTGQGPCAGAGCGD
ncbi:MAG: hypothetical protein LAN18_01945 [Acidobacteriia bacterium]|nr:hypothetical protein [Terriglobia bacterium]